ncbi:MAG: class I SAM-dependent methyltransferase [Chloroflexi bacterium]|nr:class I SAM-dependent methyltransferase [Chloroflexota bacterium]
MTDTSAERYAQLYDALVPDWPGEMAFYRDLAAVAAPGGESILEVACGTGRVTLQLAREGLRLVGLDRSGPMLAVARQKSAGVPHLHWVEGDMRSFELNETFGLIIIPGHSFQYMLTPEDQIACLGCIRRHLVPGGRLVVHLDHQNISWLAELYTALPEIFTAEQEVTDTHTGHRICPMKSWSYAPSTQTASVVTEWFEFDAAGQVIDTWQTGPVRLHCVFRFEMAHLLARARFAHEAVYGDFFRGELQDNSPGMIGVARQALHNG